MKLVHEGGHEGIVGARITPTQTTLDGRREGNYIVPRWCKVVLPRISTEEATDVVERMRLGATYDEPQVTPVIECLYGDCEARRDSIVHQVTAKVA